MRVAYRSVFAVAFQLVFAGSLPNVSAAEPASDHFAELGDEYRKQIRPLVEQFCLDCHSTEIQEGDLDLQRFSTLPELRRGSRVWVKVAEMLAGGAMPPEDSEQPSPEQRKQLRTWIERYLHAESLANAGDPGLVVMRRLNNAEYTYTVRALTGVDLNPAREFPTDSSAGEGFTNTGNALVMSPALLVKYLDAGKEIARHAVLLPDGLRFSPHTTPRDWTNEALAPIRGFYQQYVDNTDLGIGQSETRIGLAGRLPLEKYFAATLTQREALTSAGKTIEAVARELGLSAKYLGTLWSSLTASESSLLLDGLRSRWRDAQPDDAAALAAEVGAWQKGLWTFRRVGLIGRVNGPSRWMEPVNPLVTQEELRYAIPKPNEGEDKEDVLFSLTVTDAGDGNEHDFVVFQQPRLVANDRPDILLRDVKKTGLDPGMFGKHPNGEVIDDSSICVHAPSVIQIRLPAEVASGREFVTTALLEKETGLEGSAQVLLLVRDVHRPPSIKSGLFTSEVTVKFSKIVKLYSDRRDVFYRGPFLVSEESAARRRIESAMDDYRSLFPAALCFSQIVPVDEILTFRMYYREDDHLARLMLDDKQQARLDRLWRELHYVSRSPLKQVDALESILEFLYGHPSKYESIAPLRTSFSERAAGFRKELIDSEPTHVAALIDFAVRAYRRPLTDSEVEALRDLYRGQREQKLSHEDAFRMTLARIFISVPFLYRLEEAPTGPTAAMVSDWELASRLSYFLWSSMPDDELGAAAEAGLLTGSDGVDGEQNAASSNALHDSELQRQTRRMLKHDRVRRLATEFACQWLRIYEFDPLEEKSEKIFPEFTELRGDMYDESIRFFTDLFQHDASLVSLLDADHIFVNERLAKFYGVPWHTGKQTSSAATVDGIRSESNSLSETEWRRVDGVRGHGRGGILALAATLAKHSGATRTSPTRRGNWVSEVLLGEKLPRPPQNVPELADIVPEGLTERQLIEQHSSNPACTRCHIRIDPFGFALENFDALGRWREKSAGGAVIDSRAALPEGTSIEGLSGLREYLLENRRDEFLRQFCRKLLGYAVGREVQLLDEPLLDDMMNQLAKNDYRFSVVVNMIVSSDQFRKIRGNQ